MHPADQICTILKRIYDKDMTTLTGGNLSIWDDDGVVWVSPTNIDKSALTRNDIVKILPDGSIEGRHRPTSEYRIHWQILQRRKDLKAVLHAHPPALVAMSVQHEVPDTRMLAQSYHAVGIPGLSEYGMPGTLALVEHVVKTFDQGVTAAVLKNHGVFLGSGVDLFDAFRRFEQLDFHARIQLLSGILGPAKGLSVPQIEELYRKGPKLSGFFDRDVISSRELELRRELAWLVKRGYEKRLFNGSFGTISARVKEDEFLISPAGKDNAQLSEQDFVLMRGNTCEQGQEPDLFADLHRRIYERHPKIQSIIMAAPVYAAGYAVTEREYEVAVIPESYGVLRSCTRIPFDKLVKEPQTAADVTGEEDPFCILDNLGILVMGISPLMAFDKLEVAESTAMSIHMAYISGKEMKVMTDEMKKEQDQQE